MIPSAEKCLELIEKYEMLDNIRDHSSMVERVAGLIARELQAGGLGLSLEKISAGALMHDIGKTHCIKSGGDHTAQGREICLENHLYEIADIVEEHVRLRTFEPDGVIQEKEIVYYADKRVKHSVVVSLDERLDYILDRYGKNEAWIRRRIIANFEQSKMVEKKIFAKLGFMPGELPSRIGSSPVSQ